MFFSDNPLIDLIARGLLLGPMTLLWVVGIVKFNGLRSFSKMTAFDFISTLATASLLASAARAENWISFFQSSLAIFAILGFQYILAIVRLHHKSLEQAVLNQPVLLFKDGAFYRIDCRAGCRDSPAQ